MNYWVRFLLTCLVVTLLVALPGSAMQSQASPLPQIDTAQQRAQEMLTKLTPEERVGQLFLVTFQGSTFDETSQIYDLITKHHIGGVILLRANENFNTPDSVINQTYALNRLLQESEWKGSVDLSVKNNAGISYTPQYIPLLIGVSQEGDEYPNDQIISGLTPLPDLMSIGATWNTGSAEEVGAVMGKELSALGFNLLLGPSLDVLSMPQTSSSDNLGVRSFGGNAYWVGKMGQAYISGLHQGSNNRLMVVSKHFPGLGASDRSVDDEIATIRKSLDELKTVEMKTFFAVTGNAPEEDMMTDGLLVPHVRYQALQGNIRSTTRPISADAAALDQLLKQPGLVSWRDKGGVLISDNLGSSAVRKFYDPTGTAFDARTAAREAFFAGNDLLYVDRFVATNDPDPYTTILHTMDFFAQKYREDTAFAQRVDASVLRILTQKYRLYPNFTLENVVPPNTSLAEIGQSQQVTFDVARGSVTLISPDASDLANILPRGPEPRDHIVFLTDVQTAKQCNNCPEEPQIAFDALQNVVLKLYGPRAGGQVSQNLLSSYSFMDLWKYLNGIVSPSTATSEAQPKSIENDLKLADWVVVSMLKPNPGQQESQAFRQLLSTRPDLLRNKKVVVFAFDVPYYLDATDISKISAYYGLYSKSAPFIDVAARILFQELSASASLPVSVPGIGYNVSQATSPDSAQVIPLYIDASVPAALSTLLTTQEPTAVPVIRVGDVMSLRTGVIFDQNHNPVPDGTPVHFVFNLISVTGETSGSTQTQIDTETVDGVARYMYRIERPGILEIHAASEGGARTDLLRLDITSGVSRGITQVAPSPMPTETLVPTPTVTVTVTPQVTPTPLPPPSVHFQDWFFVLMMVMVSAVGISWLGIHQTIARWGLRWALCGFIGGMLFYNYLALDLPGSKILLQAAGRSGILLVAFTGVILGWIVGLIWRFLTPSSGRSPAERAAKERPATGPKSQSS